MSMQVEFLEYLNDIFDELNLIRELSDYWIEVMILVSDKGISKFKNKIFYQLSTDIPSKIINYGYQIIYYIDNDLKSIDLRDNKTNILYTHINKIKDIILCRYTIIILVLGDLLYYDMSEKIIYKRRTIDIDGSESKYIIYLNEHASVLSNCLYLIKL